MRSLEKACPLLVPLVEEGWIAHPVTRDVLRIYLAELAQEASSVGLQPDALVLGCTHYPLLRAELEAMVPPGTSVIDSAEVTAEQAAHELGFAPIFTSRSHAEPALRFYATDGLDRFRSLGSLFLNRPIAEVTLADLGG
jgi:glutamate racemase